MTHTLRQGRGYRFESYIVDNLNMDDWQCRRLGGSSMGMPDEVATYNDNGILLSIEAKSTVGDYCYIPNDQLERCNKICKMFNFYLSKRIILAFKFAGKPKIRKLKYYFFIIYTPVDFTNIKNISCNYEGTIKFNGAKKLDIFSYSICHSIDELKRKASF